MTRSPIAESGYTLGLCVFFALLCAFCFSACKKEASSAQTIDVLHSTIDGVTLSGTLYTAARQNPPGIIFLHQSGGSRQDWLSLIQRAQESGYNCIAYDLRGHGQSVEESRLREGDDRTFHDYDLRDWNNAITDIGFFKQELINAGTDPENIFIIGAALGGQLAIKYAVTDSQIQAVTLLSPGLNYKGLTVQKEVAENRRLPLLLIAAQGDTYSASSAATLKDSSPAYAELRTYAGTAHGIDLLASHPALTTEILEWFKPILK